MKCPKCGQSDDSKFITVIDAEDAYHNGCRGCNQWICNCAVHYKYTKCRKCGSSITANDIDQCSKCFMEQARNEMS